jgi:hypothetical protein
MSILTSNLPTYWRLVFKAILPAAIFRYAAYRKRAPAKANFFLAHALLSLVLRVTIGYLTNKYLFR